MVTISDLLNEVTSQLEANGVDSARLDATIILSSILQQPREYLLLNQNNSLNNNSINDFFTAIARRSAHEPVAYIIGKKEFWSLDFFVTRDTLIPRPDSETLIEETLRRLKGRSEQTSILDIGTGTGCLMVALLKELPRAIGVGVDCNEGALQVAEANAKAHDVQGRVSFLKSHWCDAIVDRTFDLIVSNPPYIAASAKLMPDVALYEPREALFAGHDGLEAYRDLAPRIAKRLKPGGLTVLEIGSGQEMEVMSLLKEQGLTGIETAKDLAGITRCVSAIKHN